MTIRAAAARLWPAPPRLPGLKGPSRGAPVLVSRIELNDSLRSSEVQEAITSKDFDVPTTAALFGNTLALVNAKFATPSATSFEVVLVRACNGG
jgi:hypothetical protein